jgi:glyoxylase-like metal-dependent hydrolase (beta-lactamase superfamily II)
MSVEHIRTWRIGEVEISRIVEVWNREDPLSMLLENGTPEMMLAYPWLQPHHATPAGNLLVNFQGFVIKAGQRRIIIDTCIGADRQREYEFFSNLQSKFLQDLEAIGIKPPEVDTVLCTHLHFDHVGWNTHFMDGHWVPTFPNARYLLGRKEYEHWMLLRATGGYHDVRHLGECIDPIVSLGLADFVESDHRLSPEISLEPSPGHTPGHVSVRISSRGEEAIITGDLLHNPIQIAIPRHPGKFDMDTALAAEQRARFVERYRDRSALVIGSHFCEPTAGWIVADGNHWKFEGAT